MISAIARRAAAQSSVGRLAASTTACARRALHTSTIIARQAQRSTTAAPVNNVRLSQQRAQKIAERAASAPAAPPAASPFPSADAFLVQVDATYARLRTGLADMLAANPAMQLLSDANAAHSMEVACGPERGSFTFHVDEAAHQLIMFTPVTAATYKYNFDSVNSLWRCAQDGHALEELFVRDIINTGLYDFPKL